MRRDLASLVETFRAHDRQRAVVEHRGNRQYATSYGELATLAGRFAAELARREIGPGERVVLWGANSAAWIAAFFGCLLRGVIVVPLDAAGSVDFATRVIDDVGARLIVGDRSLLRTLRDGRAQMRLAAPDAELPQQPDFEVDCSVRGETAFQIVFTSGTTAEPRGIVHTHTNVLASLGPIEGEIARYRRYERWVHPLRFLHTLPLSHVFGQFMGLWIPALMAAEVHFLDRLEPSGVTDLIRRNRVSVLVAVPRISGMLQAELLQQEKGLREEIDASGTLPVWRRWWRFRRVHRQLGWRFWAVISGGAALPAPMELFWNRLGFALIQGYGTTETAALVTLNHPFRVGRGTIGRPLPRREVRLSEEGEILVRGDMLSRATWQSGAMREREREWLATGDLATMGETGELRFTGRQGDRIVTSAGMNVHPADLEAVMQRQPGVRGCVVVAWQGPTGPEPVAVVLPAGQGAALDASVMEANRELADYQQIRRVLTWPEPQFPYTSTGKLLRREVTQWVDAHMARRPDNSTSREDALLRTLAEITGEPATQEGDGTLLSEDLRLDSLGRVQLQSALEERFAVVIGDEVLARATTVGELRAALASGESAMHAEVPSEEVHPLSRFARVGAGVQPRGEREEPAYLQWPLSVIVRRLRTAFVELVMRPLVALLAKPRISLEAELPATPMLIVANHVTAYDGALILYALPGRVRRRVAIAMSGEMLMDYRHGRNQGGAVLDLLAPLAYVLMTALFNVFPLPRLRGFRRSFAHAGEAMDRGYSVMIFPEGTRSRDGQLHPFRPGIGLLALASQVPILPVRLCGLTQARSGRAPWFRSGRIEVRVGTPVLPVEDDEAGQLTRRLEEAVRQLGC